MTLIEGEKRPDRRLRRQRSALGGGARGASRAGVRRQRAFLRPAQCRGRHNLRLRLRHGVPEDRIAFRRHRDPRAAGLPFDGLAARADPDPGSRRPDRVFDRVRHMSSAIVYYRIAGSKHLRASEFAPPGMPDDLSADRGEGPGKRAGQEVRHGQFGGFHNRRRRGGSALHRRRGVRRHRHPIQTGEVAAPHRGQHVRERRRARLAGAEGARQADERRDVRRGSRACRPGVLPRIRLRSA